MVISAPSQAVASGQELTIKISLTNPSSETLRLPALLSPALGETLYSVSVIGPDGQPAKPTAFVEWHSKRMFMGSAGHITLQAGNTFEDFITITKLFDITAPQQCRIEVTAEWAGMPTTHSNLLEITVSPSNPALSWKPLSNAGAAR